MLLKLQSMTAPDDVLYYISTVLFLMFGLMTHSLMSLTARWDHNHTSCGRGCLSSSPCVHPLPGKRQNRLGGPSLLLLLLRHQWPRSENKRPHVPLTHSKTSQHFPGVPSPRETMRGTDPTSHTGKPHKPERHSHLKPKKREGKPRE